VCSSENSKSQGENCPRSAMPIVLQTLHLHSEIALASSGCQSLSEKHWLAVAQTASMTADIHDAVLRPLTRRKVAGSERVVS